MRECLRLTTAGAVGVTGRVLWRRDVEQLTRAGKVLGAPAVGEETVVSDAVETVGQDVDQEAAYELVGVERHKLVASVALGPVILPFEVFSLRKTTAVIRLASRLAEGRRNKWLR